MSVPRTRPVHASQRNDHLSAVRRADRTDADEGPGPTLIEGLGIAACTLGLICLMMLAVMLGTLALVWVMDAMGVL